jgi:hypothetical protein
MPADLEHLSSSDWKQNYTIYPLPFCAFLNLVVQNKAAPVPNLTDAAQAGKRIEL